MDAVPPELGPVQLGELTSIVTHQFNNILNDIILQLAVLERGNLPSEARVELTGVRQRSQQAALLVKELQRFGRDRSGPPGPIDLNEVVREALAAFVGSALPRELGAIECRFDLPGADGASHQRPTVRLDLSGGLPPALGRSGDVKRLLGLLLRGGASSSPGTEPVLTVRTRLSEQGPQLVVDDDGTQVAAEMLPRLFEPFAVSREGTDGLALAVCKGLARRMQANLSATNRAPVGMTFAVSFLPARTEASPSASGQQTAGQRQPARWPVD